MPGSQLTEGEKIVLIGGLLLIADLLFVPWHSVDLRGLDIAFDPTRTGVEGPNKGYGIAAIVLTAIMIATVVANHLRAGRLPAARVPWGQLQLMAGVFVAVVLVFKLLRETAFLAFGSYSAVLAGLLVAYGGWCLSRDGVAAP